MVTDTRSSIGESALRTNLRLMLCITLALTLIGCASEPTYEFDYDEYYAFSDQQTYRWYDDDFPSQANPYRRYNSSDKRIRNKVDQGMMQRGFKEAPKGNADLWVNYYVHKKQTQSVSTSQNGVSGSMSTGTFGSGVTVSGQQDGAFGSVSKGSRGSAVSVGYSSGSSTKTYEDGTAILDIIDIRTNRTVWRGVAKGRLKQGMSQGDRTKLTIEIVNELLNDFPPR